MGPLDLLLILVCLCLNQFTNFFLKKKRKKNQFVHQWKSKPNPLVPQRNEDLQSLSSGEEETGTCSPCRLERKNSVKRCR